MNVGDPIAVMDSGIGGLPYLEAARRLLPGLPFVYLADRDGFPYGTKSRGEVEAIVVDRVRRLVAAWKPRAIVIACNTASQAALTAVRTDNPGIPVIGTVPAIKPAAEKTKRHSIGVLATTGTIDDPYLDDLVSTFAPRDRVTRRGAPELVDFVECSFIRSTAKERRAAILPHIRAFVEERVDVIVLACTHFLHLAEDIALCATDLAAERGLSAIDVIDSREGVARRLCKVLEAENLKGGDGIVSRGFLLLTGAEAFEARYGEFAERYDLDGPHHLDKPLI